ncbi:mucin-22-like [Mytilus edulis]|uniref:mucin-22-like n=1 Tax=Mytilus edulis TaxID=6550 RepID=UPI0039EDF733
MEKKASSITSIILFIFTGHITFSTSEPCADYVLLEGPKEEARSPLLESSGFAISDDRLATGWYRSNLTAGTDMTKDCPLLMRCGTLYPIWLNGTIPAVSDGEVERSVCKLSISGSCCDSSYNSLTIKIKNCGDFRVYYLDTSGVPASSAFCFGDIPKETTTSDQTVMTSSGMSTLQSTAMPDSESTMSGSQNIVTTTSVKPTTQNSTTVEQGTQSSTSVINQFMSTDVKHVTKTTTETTTLPASVGVEMTTITESTTLITATDSTVKSITGNIGLTNITDSSVTSTQTNTTLNDESSVQIETVTGNGLSINRNNELATTIALTTVMGREIIGNNASSTTMLRHNHSTTFNRKDQVTKTIITKRTENVSVSSSINNFKTIPNSGVTTTNHDTFNGHQLTTEEVHMSTNMTTVKTGSIQNDVSTSTDMVLIIVACVCVTLAVICVIGMIVLCCILRKRQNQRKSSLPWEQIRMDNIKQYEEIQQNLEYDYIDDINVGSNNDASFNSFRGMENRDDSSSRYVRYVEDPTEEKNVRYVEEQSQENSYYHSMAEGSSQKTSSNTYDYIESDTTENTELYHHMSSPAFDIVHYTNKEKMKEASSEKDFEHKYNTNPNKAVETQFKVETEEKLTRR